MSNLRLGTDDYPCAAGKHMVDGEVLMQQGRPDGAAYHAGYVIECVIKTILLLENCSGVPPKPPAPLPGGHGGYRHHDLDELSQDALIIAALSTSRYARFSQTIDRTHPMHTGWTEQFRYRAEGALTDIEAASWVSEARRVYDNVIKVLCLRGEVVL